MQEMSHIKELYVSANILQGKFNLWDCVFIPTKEHSLSRRAQWGFAGEEGECKKKKIPSLRFTTTKGTSKTFLYNYKILFHYNLTSLNKNLPGFDSEFLESFVFHKVEKWD